MNFRCKAVYTVWLPIPDMYNVQLLILNNYTHGYSYI